jgi:alcohol dehydrogenase class IV
MVSPPYLTSISAHLYTHIIYSIGTPQLHSILPQYSAVNYTHILTGVSAHTPISECLEMIAAVRTLDDGIDCIITLGGGSITDAGKLVRFALANDAFTEEEVNTLWGGHSHNPKRRENIKPPTIALICIPTSLSGGEYQHILGATETVSHAKRTFEPKVNPTLTIQDPELCLLTPQWLWLSSGIKAVDIVFVIEQRQG